MAEKPSPNGTKKKVEEYEKILSDSDSSETEFGCKTCKISFTSLKSYRDHEQGKKHLRKLAEAEFKASSKKREGKKDAAEEDDGEDSDEQVYCDVCDKYLSSYISYASHMKGSQHAKNVKTKRLKEQMKGMPEVIKGNDQSDDDYILKPFAECKTCKKEFSDPRSLKMHMESSAHKKKVKLSNAMQKLKSEASGEKGGNSDDEELFKRCDICEKSFSGIVPYRTHMASKVHQKKVNSKKIEEEIKQHCDFDDGHFICKECKKRFTDPQAFKQHQKYNNHEKEKSKAEMTAFLEAHREIKFVVPDSKELGGNSDDSEDDSVSMYYLICTLCKFSFSGPESANDHVKGKDHLKALKERKMKKIIKKQKESSTNSDVGNTRNNEGDPPLAEGRPRNNEGDPALAEGRPRNSEGDPSLAEGRRRNSDSISHDDFEILS